MGHRSFVKKLQLLQHWGMFSGLVRVSTS